MTKTALIKRSQSTLLCENLPLGLAQVTWRYLQSESCCLLLHSRQTPSQLWTLEAAAARLPPLQQTRSQSTCSDDFARDGSFTPARLSAAAAVNLLTFPQSQLRNSVILSGANRGAKERGRERKKRLTTTLKEKDMKDCGAG